MTTMTASSRVQSGCRFASEESTEKSGTITNCVHHGKRRSTHGWPGGRKQPSTMCSRATGAGAANVNVPVSGAPPLKFAKLAVSETNVPESVSVATMRAASAARSCLAPWSKRRYRSEPICRPNPCRV